MPDKNGVTLFEIIFVLILVGVILALVFPNFVVPTEIARSTTAQNNLLALYSAEMNYANNNGGALCLANSGTGSATCQAATSPDTSCAGSIAAINCNLSLNIPDDGTYTYTCPQGATIYVGTCTATRNNASNTPVLTLTLNAPINISGSGTANPTCTAGNSWCPH